MKQSIPALHLPQELTINYQPPHGPGRAYVEISLGIASEADEFRTSWKETENAIEFSGVCPLSNTNNSIKISHDGCKLKAKNWSNDAEFLTIDKLYALRHKLMSFVNSIVESGQSAIAHDRFHTSINSKIKNQSSRNLSNNKAGMKGSQKAISEVLHPQSVGNLRSQHNAINNIIAIIDGMEHVSSSLLEKMILLKSKISMKAAVINQKPEESAISLQKLKSTIEGIRTYAEQALDELTLDNHVRNKQGIRKVLDARKHVYSCLLELMEVKRLLSQAFATWGLTDERKLTVTPENKSYTIDGNDSEKMLKTVMYDSEPRPNELENFKDGEDSNAEAVHLVDSQYIYMKNEPTVTVLLHSDGGLNEDKLQDKQQLIIAVNEDKKSETVLGNQNDFTVLIDSEENTTNSISEEKGFFTEIECNCSLENHHNKRAEIGCGSTNFTVNSVAIGSNNAFEELASKSMKSTGKRAGGSVLRQAIETQTSNVSAHHPFASGRKNKYTILISEADVPSSLLDVTAMDSGSSLGRDRVSSKSKSNVIPSESGTKRTKEVRIDESNTGSEKGWPAITGSRRYPNLKVNEFDSLSPNEVRPMKRCPNCLRSLNSTHSIGVGSFSYRDATALIGTNTSLKRPESVATTNCPYENRTDSFIPLDKRGTAINFLALEPNENQSAIQRVSEIAQSDSWKPSAKTLTGRKSYCKPDALKKDDEHGIPAIFPFKNGRTSSRIMREIININISPSPTILSLNTVNQDEATNVHIGIMDRKSQSAQDVNRDMQPENVYQASFGPVEDIWYRNNNQGIQDGLKMTEDNASSYKPSLRSLPLDEEDVKTIITRKPEVLTESDSSKSETVVWALAKIKISENGRNEIEFVQPQIIPPGVYVVDGKEITIK